MHTLPSCSLVVMKAGYALFFFRSSSHQTESLVAMFLRYRGRGIESPISVLTRGMAVDDAVKADRKFHCEPPVGRVDLYAEQIVYPR